MDCPCLAAGLDGLMTLPACVAKPMCPGLREEPGTGTKVRLSGAPSLFL